LTQKFFLEASVKRIFLLAALLTLCTSAMAGSIRVADGSLIRTGDAAARLAALGAPVYSEEIRVCTNPRTRNCDKHNSEWGHLYQYTYKNSVYTVDVLKGIIIRIESSR
jgi:hypothetical protein